MTSDDTALLAEIDEMVRRLRSEADRLEMDARAIVDRLATI